MNNSVEDNSKEENSKEENSRKEIIRKENSKEEMHASGKTAGLSALHFLVDGVCAVFMFSLFIPQKNGYEYILLYNFCAFVLQLPLGILLDLLNKKKAMKRYAEPAFIILSLLLLYFGKLHPAILGVGNALFHTGAGVSVMGLDERSGWKGRGLGTFVAPGALGLYLGAFIGNTLDTDAAGVLVDILFLISGIILLIILFCNEMRKKPAVSVGLAEGRENTEGHRVPFGAVALVSVICFLVVILRSYVGFSVAFEWKQGFIYGLAAVLAVVLGKVAGGFLSAGFGMKNTITVSLLGAAALYCLGQNIFFGLAALFLFNMTMPITLYMLAGVLKGRPGLSFGLLTAALFVGFLPVWLEVPLPFNIPSEMLGAIGSAASLILLLWAAKKASKQT